MDQQMDTGITLGSESIESPDQQQRAQFVAFTLVTAIQQDNGDLTGMDLNLYQTQLSEKKIAYAQTLINYKIELLNMKIQSLYDFETDSPIIPAELFENIVQ